MYRIVDESVRHRLSTAMNAAALVALGLAIASALAPAWIEGALQLSPDGGSGETEWALVLGCAGAGLLLAIAARTRRRSRSRQAA